MRAIKCLGTCDTCKLPEVEEVDVEWDRNSTDLYYMGEDMHLHAGIITAVGLDGERQYFSVCLGHEDPE